MKKKKRIIRSILIVSILLLCNVIGIYAIKEVSVINNLSTGEVKISLSDYMIKDGHEIKWEQNPIILPGDTISKITRISNLAEDCYIRSKLNFDVDELTQNVKFNINQDWIKGTDGYYYYTKILKNDESVDFFKTIEFPTNMSEDLMDTEINLDIEVNAIQSKNFEPQFQNKKPWGEVEIIDNKNKNIKTFTQCSSHSFLLEYKGSSQQLIINEEDLFKNFGSLMPGDKLQEELKIKNNSSKEISLYMKSIVLKDENHLLDYVNLKIEIVKGSKVELIYDGVINSNELSNRLNLGKFGNGILRYTISIPEDLNNDYSLLDTQIKWIFETDGTIKTGDDVNIILPVVALATSSIIIFFVIRKRKAGKDE